MEKESRIAANKLQHRQLIPKTVDFRCKQPDYLKKDCPKLPYCSKCRTRCQQSVLPNNRTTDGRTKVVKVLTKDVKLRERIGRKHKADHSSPTGPTNALTVQVIMEHGIDQQDSNHTHPPLPTWLKVQVFTKIVHNLKIILPNNTHNRVHPQ